MVSSGASELESAPVDFVSDVQPVLARHCVSCHGPIKQKAGLRLDAGSFILKGSDDGLILRAHDAAGSRLIGRVRTGDMDERMPPEGAALNSQEINLLSRWIDGGAVVPAHEEITDPASHWFFQAPVKTVPPLAAGYEKLTHPVDQFLAAEWISKGLQPHPPADPATLLRRLSFDLAGLPPLPSEVSGFAAAFATSPAAAWETEVDRLLASPSYGLRWGRHFMDIWRYCDETISEEGDGKAWVGQYHQWQWRDWIIESMNANKGYDRMLTEMLAGDEVAPENQEILRATAYLTRNQNFIAGRETWLTDTVEHTAQAFLGMTLKCCRCHDHKYDPLPQTDYYRFRAIFEPIESRLDAVPGVPNPQDKGVPRIYDDDLNVRTVLFKNGNFQERDEITTITSGVPAMFRTEDLKIQAVEIPVASSRPGLLSYVRENRLSVVRGAISKGRKELTDDVAKEAENPDVARTRHAMLAASLAKSEAELRAIEASMQTDDLRAAKAGEAESAGLQAAGVNRSYLITESEATVAMATHSLAKAKAAPGGDTSGETIAAQNHLVEVTKKLAELKEKQATTPPVYVSLWPEYAASSTGRRSALAKWMTARTNPATARVLVNHVWMRHFGKPLVDTVYEFGLHGKKPTHPALLDWLAVDFMEHGWDLKYLHRLLVTSTAYQRCSVRAPGSNNEKQDPENRLLWRMNSQRLQAEQVRDAILVLSGKLDPSFGGPSLDPTTSDRIFRPSLYFRRTQVEADTLMKVFDAADPSECYQRQESIVPQQALALANARLTFEHARLIAGQFPREDPDNTAFLQFAFQRVLGRPPFDAETAACLTYLKTSGEASRDPAEKVLSEEKDPLAGSSPDAAARAREGLVQALFNHTDFVTAR